MPSLPSTRALFATTAAAALFLSSFPSWVLATGDYPCTSTADCKNWETSETPLSGNSTCVADPLQPEYGYCGYAGAPCGVDADCDYGRCTNSVCTGFMGYPCDTTDDCMGWFTCGTDKQCGGLGASCYNGNADCLSNGCDVPGGSDTATCYAPKTGGVDLYMGCSRDVNCASGYCDLSLNQCAERQDDASPVGASQRARVKARGFGSTHNPKDRRRVGQHPLFDKHQLCPLGQTACGAATGYECIDTLRALESCGGCPPMYASNVTLQAIGTDCTALPNVDEVLCSNGKCIILSCLPGKMLAEDAQSCVEPIRL